MNATHITQCLNDLLPAQEHSHFLKAIEKRPTKSIRLRPESARGKALPSTLPFHTEAIPWYPNGHFCTGIAQPGRFLSYAAGDYFIQDAGSLLAIQLLDLQPTEWVADICAAPGGKASAVLEIIGPGDGFLLANEPVRSRLAALEYNLARVGYPRYLTMSQDPEKLKRNWTEQFHAVLVDAPCTGQTLVSRGKQSAAAFSESLVQHSAARQRRILNAAAALVQPGGRLVYSTCTFTSIENEQVVHTFLHEHADWTIDPEPNLHPWLSPLDPGGYRVYPHRDHCAGAYAVRLRRKGCHQLGKTLKQPEHFKPLILNEETIGEISGGERVQKKKQWEEWPCTIAKEIDRKNGKGSELAFQPAKHWMPSHALALRRNSQWLPAATFDLDDTMACQYVQGHTLPPGPIGWCVAMWQGHPLGWLRGNQKRCNNHLPSSARCNFLPQIGERR